MLLLAETITKPEPRRIETVVAIAIIVVKVKVKVVVIAIIFDTSLVR